MFLFSPSTNTAGAPAHVELALPVCWESDKAPLNVPAKSGASGLRETSRGVLQRERRGIIGVDI